MDTSEADRRLVDGRFELIAPLGSGGMGTVWRARDIALHREVALKEVRPPDPATAAAQPELVVQLRERAVREARALARLAHPNVVTIHHIVEPAADAGDHPWIVMELVKGGSLADRLAAGAMPPADVVRLGLDVLSALRAAHAEGVLHRDVKPANVLLRPDGAAVLTDFGIAALHGSTALTSTGVLIGSPEYIAPERVRGEEGLAASDLWSLGMLLYVAAEGTHPLRRATSLATVVAILDEPIPAPVRSGPLGPVLERLLVRDPAARPDGAALEALLREASAALGAAVPSPAFGVYGPAVSTPMPMPTPYAATPTHAPTPAGRTGRKAAWVVLVGLVVAGAVAGLVLRSLSDGTGREGGGSEAGRGGTGGVPAARSAAPSVAAPSAGAGSAAVPGSRTAEADLLTPGGVRTALDALRRETGTTTFADLRIYERYVLAKVPTAAGARTLDAWEYRDGVARRTGPDGTVDAGDPVIDMSTVAWDALPGLLEQSRRDLGVERPTSRYVIVDPWMMDHAPAMRAYLTDAYGQGGYVLAGTDGKVRKVYKS
ncbi:serine/threonine-protein kinase [Streptomyces sp. RerS4]|uniref:serine/threonine-protein kinase n=1 Tax=Streptomyces sp. RerS4 TaxID=2942449 RepID=UPI00201C12FE|nr:serine/threonine-protein kinase [Streptomyces sp. RerS4]UQX04285.1 serine/threonine protein kinase [Streptomyces sp. RerS4]